MAAFAEFGVSDRYMPSIHFPPGSVVHLIVMHGTTPIRQLARSEVPEVAYLHSGHKKLPEFLPINGKLAVCPEARELIEALEPGRLQFFAVTIERAKGKVPIRRLDGRLLDGPYYLLNPGAQLDAVWIEKSEVRVATYGTQPTLVSPLPGRKDRIVLRREVVEGHHVWRGRYHLGNYLFFSDTLTQAVLDRKWKGLEFIALREE